jgi:catechol 2,3-dioxygenase-like lactoylglutathione lyase family enzyme
MLSNKKIKSFVPTVMPDKAKLFYRDILGLKLLSEDKYALEFDANGTLLRVISVNELKPQVFTVLGWDVDDISATIKSLNDTGVFCEKYDFLVQDNLGVWEAPGGTKVAWFKDPDGNILSLTE